MSSMSMGMIKIEIWYVVQWIYIIPLYD